LRERSEAGSAPARYSLHVPYAAFDELLALASLPKPGDGELDLRGNDPSLPTRLRIGAAGAAAVAAAATAAAELWTLRAGGNRRQSISVDLRHATAALRSARYLRIDGAPPKEPRDRLSGLYPARDQRWVYLHCNFPNHRAAALGVLNLPADVERDAVGRAVRDWDGQALEEAIHAAGGCAGFVRGSDEWARHPQSAAVATLPVLEIERVGDAPREPLPAGERPLSGIRVLDLTRVLAGPTCGRTLAEHGADVLKVSGPHLPHSGDIEIDTGLGKLSTFLDLREPAGVETLTSLVRDGRCDVFSQSYRPGSLAARGFSAEALAALRPGIVCVELSAWGRTGPWRQRRGFDTVVQCVSGIAMIQGEDASPRTMPVAAIDYVSGYLMAFGAMVALLRRTREGGSWRVRVSLARTGRWIMDRGLLDASAIAEVPNEFPDEEIARITVETPSPLGAIRHLAPVARMSATPPRWARPPVPLGHDAPVWPDTAR
jgi:crotonobetainyl-CoA:carnitine CoA-transferase CaiB-like acyl-CoA transferase